MTDDCPERSEREKTKRAVSVSNVRHYQDFNKRLLRKMARNAFHVDWQVKAYINTNSYSIL